MQAKHKHNNQGPSSPLMRNPQPASPLSSPAGSPAAGPGTVAVRGEATNDDILLGRQVMTILTMLLLAADDDDDDDDDDGTVMMMTGL
jgi:hypothetical protein